METQGSVPCGTLKLLILKSWRVFKIFSGVKELKEWECVQVNHHKDVGRTIIDYEEKGWRLNSYQATGQTTAVNHYLLFERGQ